MKELIDGEVIPREHEIERFDVAGLAALEELKSEAKRRDLWALGHPSEVGGGGLPFMDFALLNEIIGRSEFGQLAVGSMSMQDSIMLHLYASSDSASASSSRSSPGRSTQRRADRAGGRRQ